MKKPYEVYFVDKSNRIECMLVCSLKKSIDWCESGLRIVSWKYRKAHHGECNSINEAFNRHARFELDRRRKEQLRTINIGDIILFNDIPYIVSTFSFIRVPDILWSRMNIK